jgi:cytochrome c biogenesis protein CcdA
VLGLDDRIAALAAGHTLLIVLAVAILLGLRHASDPDHLTAVTALLAGEGPGPRRTRAAGRLGLAWGAGHATTLFAFGLPVVVLGAYLPAPVQAGAEAAVGVLIIALAARLLARRRRFGPALVHSHPHGPDGAALRYRSPLQAYGIGLVHGAGGSAGVGVLLLAATPDHVHAVLALAVFALFTAISMASASTSFGWLLGRKGVERAYGTLAPAMGVASLGFGVWYALGAVGAVPYSV